MQLSPGLPTKSPCKHISLAPLTDALTTIVAACQNAGVVPGIHSSGSLTPLRLEQGFRMITVTADNVAMNVGVKAELARARGEGAEGSNAMY